MSTLLLLLICLSFLLLGIYGGMSAISRWVRGYSGFLVFSPVGAAAYFSALVLTGIMFFKCMAVLRAADSALVLLLLAMLPFAILGHVLWAFGAAGELFTRVAGASQLPIAKTFDKGDALMARARYAEAEAQYRQDLAEEPLNAEALLRVCKALEADGRVEDAVRELSVAHQITCEGRDKEPLKEQQRCERVLRITYTLGDLLVTKVERPEEARLLYERTLQSIYGYKDADPLRDRLRALEDPTRLKHSDAVRQAQPDKIPL
jgi:tetratricopeptide (TPR) repeat protein